MRFAVTVDGLSLGHWSACRGLQVDLKTIRVREGGNYGFEQILPDRISYSPVTLERAVESAASAAVQSWLRQVASQWMGGPGGSYQAGSAQITLLDAASKPVTSWTLTGVYPSSWSGPALNATEDRVAIETLVLEHEGFL